MGDVYSKVCNEITTLYSEDFIIPVQTKGERFMEMIDQHIFLMSRRSNPKFKNVSQDTKDMYHDLLIEESNELADFIDTFMIKDALK